MSEQWTKSPHLKCVVLCAGEGRRLHPSTSNIPKVLCPVSGIPVLRYVIEFWRGYTEDFVFVIHHRKEDVIEFVRQLPVNSICVEQKELRGIADAVAIVAPYVEDRFILVLGDCICDGEFLFPDDMVQGIGAWETEDSNAIKRSYSVELNDDGIVRKVVEKPVFLPNKWCGLGYYFFDKRVFQYIAKTQASPLRGEIEITDVVQNMINGGERISAIAYQGSYINVTFLEDLQKAEAFLSVQR